MNELGGLDETMDQNEEKVTPISEVKNKRKPFHFWEVAGKEYKLKLNAAQISKLETKYRTSIVSLATEDGIPPLSVMLTIIQGAMLPWQHGTTFSSVQGIYDAWVEEGGNQMDLYTKILMPTMAVSGFFTKAQTSEIMEQMESIDDVL